jgi:hypothetical protein
MYDEAYERHLEQLKAKESCDISGFVIPFETKPVKAKEKKPAPGVLESLPPEKFAAMQKHAMELRRKFPHMKPNRIKKKVAEYFKVKLV